MLIQRLSPRQADVVRALLTEHPAFEPPNPPVSIEVIALALGVRPSTVKEHLRRIRRRRPELYAQLMAHRRLEFARYHAAVVVGSNPTAGATSLRKD